MSVTFEGGGDGNTPMQTMENYFAWDLKRDELYNIESLEFYILNAMQYIKAAVCWHLVHRQIEA